jgi:glutathione S-transferase
MRFVEPEEARQASGLRVVIAINVPSPWSQAALGAFDMKGLDYLAVRFRRTDEEIKRWTGSRNAPVVLFDDEPPRTGWAEILTLGERLGGPMSLVPDDDDRRVRMFGLSHELLGEGGLCWNVRLLLTHASLATDGRAGWPKPVAEYLAPRYGYAPDRAPAARARAIGTLRLLDAVLAESRGRGHGYFLGPDPTALDIHAAVALNIISLLPEADCPMPAPVRHAFETLDQEVKEAVSPALLEHRARMFKRHLVLPVRS